MKENQVILQIPVEIVDVVFNVERNDPLEPVLEALKFQKIKSKLHSIHRLSAISGTNLTLSKDQSYPTIVVRDLWKGQYWNLKERNLSLEQTTTLPQIQVSAIERMDTKDFEGEVKAIAKPFLGWLAHASGVDRKEILAHIRLEELASNRETIFLNTLVSQREDRIGRKFWVHEEGPFKQLVSDYIEEIDGFEHTEPILVDDGQNWPYSPEVEAILGLREHKKSKPKLLKVFDRFIEQIEKDKRPRLESVKQTIGFRQDIWDAAQEVISSAKNHVFVLSSFSNPDFLSHVSNHLEEATIETKPEIIISFGEPNRGRSSEDISKSEHYLSSLKQKTKLTIKGGITPKSSHAKVIVSDTGRALITSCNLFSGSFESGVLESGLSLQDNFCAASILGECIKGEWVPEECISQVQKMRDQLLKAHGGTSYSARSLIKEARQLKSQYQESNSKKSLIKFENLLRDASEQPTWSLLTVDQHRPFMMDCIERFQQRIVMASDGLRSNGLDKATIAKIHERARKTNANVHIWWGRHAPKSKPFDEIDKRGRQEAKDRLSQLRDLSRKENKWRLLPRDTFEPMETHAKMFILDDLRLMISSDNTLSFGKTASERGDAGELGILIDHPRIAKQTRGSMELWLPSGAVIPGDITRWWALLGEAISQQTNHPTQSLLLEKALDSMMERIESVPYLNRLWVNEMEKNNDELEIINNLAKGVLFGMYRIRKSEKSQKWDVPIENLGRQVISFSNSNPWIKEMQGENEALGFDQEVLSFLAMHPNPKQFIDDALVKALEKYASKTGRRKHFILQNQGKYTFKAPRTLHLRFKQGFVHDHLDKEREKIQDVFNTKFGFPLELQWPKSKALKTNYSIADDQEVTPKLWSESLIHYMKNPEVFELVSHPYLAMTTHHPRLKLGSGKLAKYISGPCEDYIEIERRAKPVKNSLYVRRRQK